MILLLCNMKTILYVLISIRMKIRQFEIIEKIGEGSFGKIYKGFNEKNKENVAVKIDTSDFNVLKHEVSILNYLYNEHVSNIPRIYWYGIYREHPTLIMTYYNNSLQDYYDIKGIINDEKMASIMIKCLDILRQLANIQVIHRDIKPQNFMLQDGELNLIDFGLSTIYSFQHSDDDINNIKAEIVGSPRFTSYFSHCGEPTSPRDDLLSLGYMYMYLNTGSLPWDEIERISTTLSVCNINHPDNIIRKDNKSPEKFLPLINDGPFKNYMKYCYLLKCDDMPDYNNLMQIFIS